MKGKTWSGCVISSSLALRASSWWARDAETCLFCSVCVGMCTCIQYVWRDSVGWRETEGAIGCVFIICSGLSVTGMSNNLLFFKYTCVGAMGYPGFKIHTQINVHVHKHNSSFSV